jgi:DNA-binding XRE family transcriptional regulator
LLLHLLSEFSEPTTNSEPVARIGSHVAPNPATRPSGAVHYLLPAKQDEPISKGYTTIDDVVAEFERDPAAKEELRRGRQWVAETVLGGQPTSLRVLRLRKGMSQAQLAEAIGTQQPHIARIERGQADLLLDTCRRIAQALEVDLNTLDRALQAETGQ